MLLLVTLAQAVCAQGQFQPTIKAAKLGTPVVEPTRHGSVLRKSDVQPDRELLRPFHQTRYDASVRQTAFMSEDEPRSDDADYFDDGALDAAPMGELALDGALLSENAAANNAERFTGRFANRPRSFDVGVDLYDEPDFEDGLIVFGKNVAMKFGGYVKADFIYDFDPIDSTDSFVTTTIPVGAPHRTNSRFHARQTRFSFDTRWAANERVVKVFVEGDFFGANNNFRLRHAYGEVGRLLVGRTWTTFTDVAAAPPTLDFEGSVSSVNRRQAQARWTQPIFSENLTLAAAVEDTRFIIEPPPFFSGEPRSPSPDLAAHIRSETDWFKIQLAGLYRLGGFQLDSGDLITGPAWGLNFTGAILLTKNTKAYYQVLYGEGIGSYRDLTDAAPVSLTEVDRLPIFGWMLGVTREWTDQFSSNFTYAENSLDNTPLQSPDEVHRTTYLAANLIWNPWERVHFGIEYLYGIRENVNGATGDAHRLQTAFLFSLP